MKIFWLTIMGIVYLTILVTMQVFRNEIRDDGPLLDQSCYSLSLR